jgi:hypothetical protein
MADVRHDGTELEDSQMLDNVNKVQFGLGLLVVVVAASLLLMDVLESGAAAGFGFIGIVLISAQVGIARTPDSMNAEVRPCHPCVPLCVGGGVIRGS